MMKYVKKLGQREVAIPVLYLAGAAGSLAYGTYSLVKHLKSVNGKKGTAAKVGVPVVLGSGLAYLGVRDLKHGTPLIEELIASPRGAAGSKGGRSRARGARSSRGSRKGSKSSK